MKIFLSVQKWPVKCEWRTRYEKRLLDARESISQRLHGTGCVSIHYEIGTDKSCVYTRPGGFSTYRIFDQVVNEYIYEDDPI